MEEDVWFSASIFHWECFQEFGQRSSRRKRSHCLKKHCNTTLCWEHSFTKEEKRPSLATADCKIFLNCAWRQMIAIAIWVQLQHLGAEGIGRCCVLPHQLWQVPCFSQCSSVCNNLSSAGWDMYYVLQTPVFAFGGKVLPLSHRSEAAKEAVQCPLCFWAA